MNYFLVAILGSGLVLAARLVKALRTLPKQPQPSFIMTDSSTTDTTQQANDLPAADSQQASAASTADNQAEPPTDNNPLKRFQDLVNSPTTPDGHKVVAAVAAASTVTVAAVANWLMKATKK